MSDAPRSESRRAFLQTAGKAALAAPPVMTMVMAATTRPANATVAYKDGKRKKKGKKNLVNEIF